MWKGSKMLLQHFAGSKGMRIGLSAVFAALLAASMSAPLRAEDVATEHRTQHGPESVADLAESITDAVVNIAITQSVKPDGDEGFPSPNLPNDAPSRTCSTIISRTRAMTAPIRRGK